MSACTPETAELGDEFLPLLADPRYHDYHYHGLLDPCDHASHQLAQLRAIAAGPGGRALAAREGLIPRGLCVFSRLCWDSELLGRSIWQLGPVLTAYGTAEAVAAELLERALTAIEAEGGEVVVAKLPAEDLHAAHRLCSRGFYQWDTVLTLVHLRGAPRPSGSPRCAVGPFEDEDLPVLQDLAGTSFRTNRYYLDPALRSDQVDDLYATWVSNYSRGLLPGSACLVARGEGRPLGFLCWRRDQLLFERLGLSVIGRGLMAVAPEARGRGVGAALVAATIAETEARHLAAEFDCVLTASNAMRLYAGFGLPMLRARQTYHLTVRDRPRNPIA